MDNGPVPTEQLAGVRNAIFQLHKTLIDSERASYEQNIGSIPSSTHFLRLLTDDPWFAWLHPLSQLVVHFDETLDDPAAVTPSGAADLLGRTRELLTPSETGEGFARHYYDALQRDPDVLFAHVTARRLARGV